MSGHVVGWGLIGLAVVIALWALGEKAHSQDWWLFRKGQVLATGVPQVARPSSVQHTGPTFIDMHDQSQIHGGKWDIKYWDGAKPGSMDFDIWADLRKGGADNSSPKLDEDKR